MTRSELRAVQDFADLSGLPQGSYAVLPCHKGEALHLLVWVDRAFMHALDRLPMQVGNVPVSFELMPQAVAYEYQRLPNVCGLREGWSEGCTA